MKFTIIGGGSTGHAVGAYLSSKGADCTVCTRDAYKAEVLNRSGITAEGDLAGTYPVKATTNLSEAVKCADVILIMTIANAHREVAERLKPLLVENQKILIFNSNWGALEFKQVLGADIRSKNLTVAETAAQLFVASLKEPGHVRMSVKVKITVCATDSEKTQSLLDQIASYFPQFEKGTSIIETTMSTTNPVIHVPITLFNAARAENAQPFLFYEDGTSHAAVDLIIYVDRERVKVAKALGCEIDDVLTAINSFWEIKYDNLFDALTKNETYKLAVGPTTLHHRFLTEDVPYGIVPISRLGRILGVETPYTDALVGFLRCAFGDGLVDGGIYFQKEDLE